MLNLQEIVIVDFGGGGDSIKAVYVDGNLQFGGDYYHDKIEEYIEGWLDGISFVLPDIVLPIKRYSLTEESAEEFSDDFPERFPFDDYEVVEC